MFRLKDSDFHFPKSDVKFQITKMEITDITGIEIDEDKKTEVMNELKGKFEVS